MKDLIATLACFLALAAFGLGCLGSSAAQSPPAPLKIAPVLSKQLEDVEKLLGKPRHIGEEQERYYKAAGFVRVVVRPLPQKTLASIAFQFAPGTLKNERAALARVGIVDTVLPDCWTSRWVIPGDSKNDELILSRVQSVQSSTQNVILTRHFLERMQERGVSEAQARELLESGKRFYDPKNDSYIRYKDGIYIALTKDGTLKTVVRGPISKRWQPL
ncbi:DUF4258 domain-containing protein [Armatimonas sp.]|uniref:DUF4258 domain-containing protein n=1 Tax=Armatimonas sp. TaxID=1872638 RepID=UPI003750DE6C